MAGKRNKKVRWYARLDSSLFWRRVDALKGKELEAAYILGCALQDLEARVMDYLESAEMGAKHGH